MSKVLGVQNKKGWAVFLKFFVFTIAIHWGMMLLSYILLSMTQGVEESFFAMYVTKFISGGDTPHYINIATNGYMSSGESANLIVFYPLYPDRKSVV